VPDLQGGNVPPTAHVHPVRPRSADRIYRSIVASTEGSPALKPILRPYDTVGTTHYVDFHTIRETYKTRADKCHVSHVAGDSGWEFKLAHDLEDMSEVLCYVKNQNLGFAIPYSINNVEHQYYPDFLVRIDDGNGIDDPLNLLCGGVHYVASSLAFAFHAGDIKLEHHITRFDASSLM
jgi:hypothetical protein